MRETRWAKWAAAVGCGLLFLGVAASKAKQADPGLPESTLLSGLQSTEPDESANPGTQQLSADPFQDAAAAVKAACSDHANYTVSHSRDETYIPGLVPLTYQLVEVVGPYRHVSATAEELAAIWGAIYINAQGWRPRDPAYYDATLRIQNDERDALRLCSSSV